MPPFNAHTVDDDFFVSLCGTPEIPRICGYGYGHRQQPEDRIEAWLQNNIAIVVVGTMIFTAVLFYAYVLYRELYTAQPDLEQGMSREMAPHPKIGPARSVVVDALPVHTVDEEEANANAECVICCSGFEAGDKVTVLPCRHKFDSACIRTWLMQKGECPCCREQLPLFFSQ